MTLHDVIRQCRSLGIDLLPTESGELAIDAQRGITPVLLADLRKLKRGLPNALAPTAAEPKVEGP
jgi:hypothetical protein